MTKEKFCDLMGFIAGKSFMVLLSQEAPS